jgi:DNA-binding GntR family transcriptional regulator
MTRSELPSGARDDVAHQLRTEDGMAPDPAAQLARPARLSEMAAERLREQILRGQLAPGSPVSQESLARELGISRTPLRDAIKALERDGLIRLDATGAARIVDPDKDDARDLLLIREVIDSVAARRASSLATPLRTELDADLQPILEDLREAAASEDPYKFRLADSRFHVAILRQCRLENLDQCHAFVHTTALSMYAARKPSPGHLAQASDEHREITAALVAGDSERCAMLARDHVRHAYDYYYGDWQPRSRPAN